MSNKRTEISTVLSFPPIKQVLHHSMIQAAGSSAGAHMFDLPNTVGSIPTAIEVGARLRYGLTVVVGGTVDFTVVYE